MRAGRVAKRGMMILNACLLAPAPALAQELEEIVVVTRREQGATETVLSAKELVNTPAIRLDEALGRVPGLTLFRRASSRLAHPTTQGLTMRGLGPNGAGRTLVMLDGVPQNDPFGGWVAWSGLAADHIEKASIVRGPVASANGNQAIGGVIFLDTADEQGVTARASYGSRDSLDLAASAGMTADAFHAEVFGGYARTDGAWLLDETQRGPVDVPAKSNDWRVGGKLRYGFADDVEVTVSAGHFEEDRTNGTPLTLNATNGTDLSVRLRGRHFGAVAWYKDREFSSVFSAVDEARATETPSLDQYAVPSHGYGAAAKLDVPLAQRVDLTLGADGRVDRGFTHERFRFMAGEFTRERLAGGESRFLGGYASLSAKTGETRLTGDLRVDHWKLEDPQRTETDLQAGVIVRDDPLAARQGTLLNGRVGVHQAFTPALKGIFAAYTGWRLPSLNEFFRPFRVRNDVTEANPDLKPERLKGFDIGLDYDPLDTMGLSLTGYANWLKDGIGNITVGVGPGLFLGNFVPEGGTVRQRSNIDRIRVLGLEAEGHVSLATGVTARLRYLFAAPKVTRFAANPDLVGRRLPQVSRHNVVAGLEYAPDDRLHLEGGVDWRSAAFDDDLNSRRLGASVSVGLGARYSLRDGIDLSADVRNLFGRENLSALSAEGLRTLAEPRTVTVGLRVHY